MKKKLDFTKEAEDQINKITFSKEKKFFRITVQGGGCSGFKYNFGFDKKTNKDDVIFNNAIIDKTGKGKMIVLDEFESDGNTGTEIIIPIVTNNDRDSFESECYYATMFWDSVTYKNFHTKKNEIEVVFAGEGFKIVKGLDGNSFDSYYIGLLDSIPYPVYPTKFKNGVNTYGIKVLLDLEVENVTINENSTEYKKYLELSKIKATDILYSTYDDYLKKKYEIDINYQALDIVKNQFN